MVRVPASVNEENVITLMEGSAPQAPWDLALFSSRVDDFLLCFSAIALQWKGLIGG
jgi:hypothetical protein